MSDHTRALAQAIAAGMNGTVRELACAAGQPSAHVVTLADGRVPVLVQHEAKSLGVTVGTRFWFQGHAAPDAALVRDAVSATEKWAQGKPAHLVTPFEIVLDLTASLTTTFGEPWCARIDGTFERPRFTLSGANGSAASVDVDADGLNANGKIAIPTRDQLDTTRAAVIERVRAQRAQYARNVELRAMMLSVATEISQRLPWRARGVTCTLRAPSHAVSWAWAGVATLACKDARGTAEVDVRPLNDHVRVHAGLKAPRGWEGDVDVVDDAALAAIAQAVDVALGTLTLDKLRVGAKYRVREKLDELKAGEIVTFKGYDDIDNHYGRYEFVDAAGKTVGVGGDYSSPQHTTLGGDTGRYLEPLS